MFDRPVLGANIVTFLVYFSFQGIFFLLSFHLQQLLGFDSRMAGLALLPTTVLITLLSGPSGSITDRVGPRPQLITGPLLIALGVAAMVLFRSSGSYAAAILPGTVLLGVGMVLVIPSVTATALDVAEAHTGAASGFNNAAARVAGLFAVASLGTLVTAVFRGRLVAALAELPVSPGARDAIVSRTGALLALELPDGLSEAAVAQIRDTLEDSYLAGFTVAMLVIAALLAAASVTAALTTRRSAGNTEGAESA
jgi:predicted MFS family arabinose efflux permease